MYNNQTDRIREASDILKVVGYFVKLRRAGREHVGLCPFHKERTPSFTVNPKKQVWLCRGCDIGGDVFTFIERLKGLDFIATKRFLAEFAGIPWDNRPLTEAERRQAHWDRQDKLEMRTWAVGLIWNLHCEEAELLPTYCNAVRYLTTCNSVDDRLFDWAGWTMARYGRRIEQLEQMRDSIEAATDERLLELFRGHRRQADYAGDRVVPMRRAS